MNCFGERLNLAKVVVLAGRELFELGDLWTGK